jgi:hypothetical protein
MRDYVGEQLELGDAPTVWESFDPKKTGVRRWGLNPFPKSLCHGWSSGLVAITCRHLVGVRSVEPGFASIVVQPALDLRTPFTATIPTPHGALTARRATEGGEIVYVVPRDVAVASAPKAGVRIERVRS